MDPAPGSLDTFLHLFYEENSSGIFLLVTIIFGGGAAWLAGRAIALTWRPAWQVFVYSLILGCAVRFIHFALFGGTLLSLHYYLVDTAILVGLGFLGFRAARVSQMITQYRWVNAPNGPFRWRRHST
ncbi:MAG: hypothetical protein Q7T81_09000 [Pseudolabrys sp.]|nr:hypothetical protein [Pseudolabrys sp.]